MNMIYDEIDRLMKENEELKGKVRTIEKLCKFVTDHRNYIVDISIFSDFGSDDPHIFCSLTAPGFWNKEHGKDLFETIKTVLSNQGK